MSENTPAVIDLTQKRNHRGRTRKLVVKRGNEHCKRTISFVSNTTKIIFITIITIWIALVIYQFYTDTGTRVKIVDNIMEQYYNQLNIYSYGSSANNCREQFDFKQISKAVKNPSSIIQSTSNHKFLEYLENHRKVTAMAFVGGSGVGKSLLASILEQHFQWPRNIVHMTWPATTDNSKDSDQFNQLLQLTNRTINKHCGHNLIIVDNLSIRKTTNIFKFHSMIINQSKINNLKMIILYVYNVPSYLNNELDVLNETITQIVNLNSNNKIQAIIFDQFTKENLRHCIQIESEKLNVILEEEEIFAILREIDWTRSGCKKVKAKVALYTKQ